MLCYAMLCYDMLFYAMLCYAIFGRQAAHADEPPPSLRHPHVTMSIEMPF